MRRLDCRTVVDIGANRGSSPWRHGTASQTPTLSLSSRRVFARDNATVLHEAAIGPAPEQGTMHVSAQDDSSSLLPRLDWVYCECSFVELYSGQKMAADVIDWLSAKGFRIKGIYNPSYDNVGKSVQADFLFRREGEVGIS